MAKSHPKVPEAQNYYWLSIGSNLVSWQAVENGEQKAEDRNFGF
jgi:hypothetical protein